METKKKTMILSIIAIATFAILIVGATYAYFTAEGGSATSANLKVTTYTTDVFTFTTGDAINIYADQSSFASGKGNAIGSTFAKASLTANNKTNTATEAYYVYLNIENNSFEYTMSNKMPELILTVTDSTGIEVTDISGLIHTTVTDGSGATITGYDITTRNGLLTLFRNRKITTTSSKEERWNITITFVNYDKDQSSNAGKTLNAKVMIQKEQIPFHEECDDKTLACHIAKLYTGTQGENNIYYHDGTMEYGINDGSYRYAGASDTVNNYVCLGSTESPCPTDNLFRIIGIIDDQVKVIKAKSIGNMSWDNNGSNTWSTASLNLYLNGEYLTSLGDLSEKISKTTWKVGGNTYLLRTVIPLTVYQNEIVNPVTTNTTDNAKEISAKIGTVYLSDFMYAAPQDKWTLIGYNSSDTTNDYSSTSTVNWLSNITMWTITRNATNSTNAFLILNGGIVTYNDVNVTYYGVRPVFSLVSSVNYASGNGTSNNPYMLS